MTIRQKLPALAIALTVAATAMPQAAFAKKTCENTYSNGQRCTTCTYSSSGYVSVKCIKWKAPTGNSGSSSDGGHGAMDRIKALRG